jgi:hypothetical protein
MESCCLPIFSVINGFRGYIEEPLLKLIDYLSTCVHTAMSSRALLSQYLTPYFTQLVSGYFSQLKLISGAVSPLSAGNPSTSVNYHQPLQQTVTVTRKHANPVHTPIATSTSAVTGQKEIPLNPSASISRFPMVIAKLVDGFQLNPSAARIQIAFSLDKDLFAALSTKPDDFLYMVRLRAYKQNDSSQKHEWPLNFTSFSVNRKEIKLFKRTYSRTEDNLVRTHGINIPLYFKDQLICGRNFCELKFDRTDTKLPYPLIYELELVAFLSETECLEYFQKAPKFPREQFVKLGIFQMI